MKIARILTNYGEPYIYQLRNQKDGRIVPGYYFPEGDGVFVSFLCCYLWCIRKETKTPFCDHFAELYWVKI